MPYAPSQCCLPEKLYLTITVGANYPRCILCLYGGYLFFLGFFAFASSQRSPRAFLTPFHDWLQIAHISLHQLNFYKALETDILEYQQIHYDV